MIPFAKPEFSEKTVETILQNISDALKSGYLTNGPYVRLVEEKFSGILSSLYVAATSSCTASLHLAMLLAGISKGDEVIVPSNTFVSTANAVVYCGGKPIFAEIETDTFNLDPLDVENKITDQTKAIIPVHLGGNPCDMTAFQRIASEHNLLLIEDCAHAHGAYYKNNPCGTFGDLSCFSFYPTKVIPSAEGGLLVTKNPEFDKKGRILLNQGRQGFGPSSIEEIGYNYRMNELQAILINSQISMLPELIQYRTKLANRYRRNLADSDYVNLQEVRVGNIHSYYSFIVSLPHGFRDEVRKLLTKEGVETSILYHPIHQQAAYQKIIGADSVSLPTTEDICSKTIALPMHLAMDESTVDIVSTKLLESIEWITKNQ
ncbi:MAG: Aminotransferase DegT [Candidatus Thorarchaeota archaeon]|nr:MAG: Aminotransferase DegT [Candidatus Thorarchaeota archaeon]